MLIDLFGVDIEGHLFVCLRYNLAFIFAIVNPSEPCICCEIPVNHANIHMRCGFSSHLTKGFIDDPFSEVSFEDFFLLFGFLSCSFLWFLLFCGCLLFLGFVWRMGHEREKN